MRAFLLIILLLFCTTNATQATDCQPPQNFRAEIFGSTSISFNVALTWEDKCLGVVGYHLEIWSSNSGDMGMFQLPKGKEAYYLLGLRHGCYEFRLYSHLSDGTELPPVSVRLCSSDLCPRPTNDRLTRVSATRAVVTWDAVPNASQYVVYVRPIGGKTTSYPGASNTRTLVGLKPEKEYEYRIRTLCPDKKTSAFTEWKRFITPKTDPK